MPKRDNSETDEVNTEQQRQVGALGKSRTQHPPPTEHSGSDFYPQSLGLFREVF